jgi:hypothetical protein
MSSMYAIIFSLQPSAFSHQLKAISRSQLNDS